MKEISIKAYELTRDEVKNMIDGQVVLVYNPFTSSWNRDITGKRCIANYKTALTNLVYISLDEKENIKFKEGYKNDN